MFVIDASNRIVINGQRTALAVVQRGEGTVVYTPESRLSGQAYKEHKMPHGRYSLAHDEPTSGVPGRGDFERDVKALLGSLG